VTARLLTCRATSWGSCPSGGIVVEPPKTTHVLSSPLHGSIALACRRTSLVALSTATSKETSQRSSGNNYNFSRRNINNGNTTNTYSRSSNSNRSNDVNSNSNYNRSSNRNFKGNTDNNTDNMNRRSTTSSSSGVGGRGGGGGGVLKLVNPLKVQRIAAAPQTPRENGGNRRSNSDAVASRSGDDKRQNTGNRPARGANLKGEESDWKDREGGYKRSRVDGRYIASHRFDDRTIDASKDQTREENLDASMIDVYLLVSFF
jgi:hypothetical protein